MVDWKINEDRFCQLGFFVVLEGVEVHSVWVRVPIEEYTIRGIERGAREAHLCGLYNKMAATRSKA